MTNGAAAGAAAAQAARMNAIKASGVLVQVESKDFVRLVEEMERPLVVYSPKGFLSSHKYLTSYKGLAFYTKSDEPLRLPGSAEIIQSRRMSIPQ
jgi:hypothetical protein